MLLNLDTKKSPGPDKIPNAFLTRYAEWVAKYLSILFSRSLNEGQVPNDWRTARVQPVHKNGKKQYINNYRPISLTSATCKIMEHIIHTHISDFLVKHDFITNLQHGFQKGYSTCTQLVQTVHDFANSINNGNQTDAIYIDFAKAFDKVSHKKLLSKISSIIKNDKITNWISTYLNNRQQYVTFRNHSSQSLLILASLRVLCLGHFSSSFI